MVCVCACAHTHGMHVFELIEVIGVLFLLVSSLHLVVQLIWLVGVRILSN